MDNLLTIPKGRKRYNGRAERSQRNDDEELYRPLLLAIQDYDEFLAYGQRCEYFHNFLRPHLGLDIHGQPSLDKFGESGFTR
jgi:hypothetical protein